MEGLRINRLSTWGVVVQPTLMSLTVANPQIPRQVASVSPSARPVCRLELDINTAQDYQGEILAENMPKVFGEFIELANQIAEQGDVK